MTEEELSYILSVDVDKPATKKAVEEVAHTVDQSMTKTAAKTGQGFFKSWFGSIKKGGGREIPSLLGGIFGQGAGGGIGGAVGGGLGAAAGGFPGAVVGKLLGEAAQSIPKILGTAVAVPAKMASGALGTLGRSLRELQGPLGPIGLGFDVLTASLETVSGIIHAIPIAGTVLGPLSDVLAGIPGLFKDVTTSLIGMAEKASPGQLRMWQIALEDVQGVIGRAFLPVLEIMREGVRLFGDVLANILPNMSEARGALTEARIAFAEMGREIRAVLAEIGPSIRELFLKGLQQLAHWAAVAAKVVMLLGERLKTYFGIAPRVLGAAAPAGRTAAGASAQPVSITGIEEYQRTMQTRAFAMPGALSAEEKQIAALTEIGATNKEAVNLLSEIDSSYEWTKTQIISALSVAGEVKDALSIISGLVKTIADYVIYIRDKATISDATADKIAKVIMAPTEGRRALEMREETQRLQTLGKRMYVKL